MYSRIGKISLILVILITSLFVLVGCSDDGANDVNTNGNQLTVSVDLPELINAQSLDITLKCIEVTITNQGDANDIQKKTVNINDGDSSVALNFTELQNGTTYDVAVKAIDSDGFDAYTGTSKAVINGTSTVNVSMELVDAEGIVFTLVNIPAEAVSGEINLVPEELGIDPVEVDISTSKAEFGQVPAGEYSAVVKLYDNSNIQILNKNTQIFKALPGRINACSVNVDQTQPGDLIVTVDFAQSPEPPTGLTAEFNEATEAIDLSWDDTAEKYLIYRGTNESEKMLLIENAISSNSYSDTSVKGAKTYYYWVRGYAANGLASDLSAISNPVSTPVPEGIIVHYKDTSGTPNIYTWTSDETLKPSGGWPGSAMESEGNDWYATTIETADFEGYESLNIIFIPSSGGQTDDLSRTLGEWWYKDGSWYDSNPEDI